MMVMTDIALDRYSSYGHDGIVEDGDVVNDPTVDADDPAWRSDPGTL